MSGDVLPIKLNLCCRTNLITSKTDAYEGREFNGEISFIDSRVNEDTRSIKVRAIVDNSDLTLRPGLLLNIVLFRRYVLLALIKIGDLIFCYVYNCIWI